MFEKEFAQFKGSYKSRVTDLMQNMKSRMKADELSHYDYTSFCYHKRQEIAVNGLEKLKSKLNANLKPSFIEAYFAFSNGLIMRGGYNDAVDGFNMVTISAAIWILDQLSLQGKLEECYPYLPVVQENFLDEILLPYVNHPIYDFELILSMVLLIRHRNTAKALPKREAGALLWESNKIDRDEAARKNRSDFEAVMALLDSKAVERAVKRYEEDVWSFYRISFSVLDLIERYGEKLERELDEIEANTKNKIVPFTQVNVLSNPPKMGSGSRSNKDDSTLCSQVLIHKLEWLNGITLTQLSLANDREKVVRSLGGIAPKALADELIHFRVDDPFESSFALLHLLDSGSDIPWFYYGSISVAYTLCDQLPYDTERLDLEKPVLLSEWNRALYEHRYSGYRWTDRTDVLQEPVQRNLAKNLSQMIYANTLSLFPRVVPEIKSLDVFLNELGEMSGRERELSALMLYALHADNLRPESLKGYRLENEVSSDQMLVESEFMANDDLVGDNRRLRQKNAELISTLRENLDQKRMALKRLEAATALLDQQGKELADLREKVFLLTQEEIPEETEDKEIIYPYLTKGKILSFGGHASWIKEMKKRLPNVIFTPPDVLPNTDLIRGADEVWIQTNCISHKDYYRIMDILRNMDKQVRYFVYAGVNKCAEQVVKASEPK